VPMPCSQTPARLACQVATAGQHGPTCRVRRGLSTRGNFGAQSHGLSTGCLRFAVRLAPPHARLASGCPPSSTRRDWLPAGFRRKVSVMLRTSRPPFPSFVAQTLSPYPALQGFQVAVDVAEDGLHQNAPPADPVYAARRPASPSAPRLPWALRRDDGLLGTI
jgi:hypothetical protein